MGFCRGQGATEYLVLLAVVLIVALVSVALLGFFPGMASDSQMAQSQTYWRSAQPISMTEWAAKARASDGTTFPYFRVRNSGAYPIRITGIVGGDGVKITQVYIHASCGLGAGQYNITDYYYLGAGEEKYFGYNDFFGLACDRYMGAYGGAGTGYMIGGASSTCANSSSAPGTFVLPSMGFEYIEYLDNNQQITKRQIGQEVVVKCLAPQ